MRKVHLRLHRQRWHTQAVPADMRHVRADQLPPPPSQADMDAFHADAHHFLARCFMKQDRWGDYTKVHRLALHGAFPMAAPYLANTSHRVLHLGDGQGYMPMLFHKYLGLTRQVAVDGAPFQGALQ